MDIVIPKKQLGIRISPLPDMSMMKTVSTLFYVRGPQHGDQSPIYYTARPWFYTYELCPVPGTSG